MNDIYKEKYSKALALYEDDELAKNQNSTALSFRWSVVQSTTKDVGKILKTLSAPSKNLQKNPDTARRYTNR